jgi:AraC family transcriptional regulator
LKPEHEYSDAGDTPYLATQRTSSCRSATRPTETNPLAVNELRIFDADVLVKRSEEWAGGRAVLVDRQPRGELTKFAHCLTRHTIALHVEGANTSATLKYDDGNQDVTGSTVGQVMFVPARRRLEGFADYPSKFRHLLLTLDPQMLDCECDNTVDFDTLDLPYRQNLNDGVIAGQMRVLQSELDQPGPLSRLFVESLCCEIAVRSLRICTRREPMRISSGLAPRRLRLVKNYIEANLSNNITLADLAAIADVSASHFSRAFRASTGIGAHRYIIRQRIEQAKRLLTESKMSIAEIALAAGFGNQSHLTTHFRREVGTTPARFRNLA